ncbi:MAG: hypothetical protein CBB71_04545 [Rhodopirellula sp. TMED11]|nr:MAG: hypothetical protein CBB71_04545 [Rhodopirellula sp. TMED11]
MNASANVSSQTASAVPLSTPPTTENQQQRATACVALSSQNAASRRAIERLIPRVRDLIHRHSTTATYELPAQTLQLARRAQSEWLSAATSRRAGRLDHSQQAFVAEAIALAALGLQKALSIMPYDCQIAAGIALAHNQIVQMQTGEGKTYSGALVSYLLSLTGRGVHVCLPNAYLAERDQKLLQPAFEALGVRTALRGEHDSLSVAQAAYRADITYAAGHLFGFDYLRDQAEQRDELAAAFGTSTIRRLRGTGLQSRLRQIQPFAAVVDEADQVLIDDALTPLLVTERPEGIAKDAAIHRAARAFSLNLQVGQDYTLDPTQQTIELTQAGFERIYECEKMASDQRLAYPWHHYVVSALKAEHTLHLEKHYTLLDDQLHLVEQSTGRIFRDRQWASGLHQAVEVKEGLRVSPQAGAQGKITRQAYFALYPFLSGMTGTADGCRKEFRETYRLPTTELSPRLPCQRVVLELSIHRDQASKRAAICRETAQVAQQGRAVMIGTNHIDQSIALAAQLESLGLKPQVLNGVQSEQEAAIVANAGQSGQVTVATHLAGRGTDIHLSQAVRDAGGLHVIGMEHHKLRRVDRQLIGRCARQGDPGTARFYVALEDAFINRYAPYLRTSLAQAIERPRMIQTVTRRIEKAQLHAEATDRKQRGLMFQRSRQRSTAMSARFQHSNPIAGTDRRR